MITTNEILQFLNIFGIIVEDNETSEYVDLMMDNHKCIEFDGTQYYIPESSVCYSDNDLVIYDLLIDKYII